ncbi:MAG: response regulator transcription factor [Clostridia bacterium]|nr:response regulator transcription factor [Clostridia bacterium]
MHFVVVDDIAIHRELLTQRLQEVCTELAMEYDIPLSTQSGEEVLAYAAHAPEGTVYLLDIELAEENNGIALCRRLHEVDPDGYIVYVSAYERYALECCQSHAFDFLLKPWTAVQLRECIRAIRKAMDIAGGGHDWLTVNIGSRTLRLKQSDIVYLSKEHNNVTIHLRSGDTIQQRTSFEALLRQLKAEDFLRCHKCYVVRRNAVSEYSWAEDELIVCTGETLPISRRRAAAIRAEMTEKGVRA